MGWWRVADVVTGRPAPGTRATSYLSDAVPEQVPGEAYIGDQVIEIMDGAVRDICHTYRRALGRRPTRLELAAVLNYCLGPESDPEEHDDTQAG